MMVSYNSISMHALMYVHSRYIHQVHVRKNECMQLRVYYICMYVSKNVDKLLTYLLTYMQS